jgi:hypothetical protein
LHILANATANIAYEFVLFLVGAGGMFGFASPWVNDRPWYMQPLWDLSSCCPDVDTTSKGKFFALVRAIFGYQVRTSGFRMKERNGKETGTPLGIITGPGCKEQYLLLSHL